MKTYITEEQIKTINEVCNNHGSEYENWCVENIKELMEWFNNDDDMLIERRVQRFGYYCANKFMESRRSEVIAED